MKFTEVFFKKKKESIIIPDEELLNKLALVVEEQVELMFKQVADFYNNGRYKFPGNSELSETKTRILQNFSRGFQNVVKVNDNNNKIWLDAMEGLAKTCEHIKSEDFIDQIVERLKRKQL